MIVYSYYYGASAGRGIGTQAQSKELESLSLRSDLKDLSSLHALESSEHSGEMLSYMLTLGGYTILGLSYIESPKSSGYSRSAPCGLQYIIPEDSMEGTEIELGRIINFVNFQKPASAIPAPLESFPLNESGYSFHNSKAVLAPLVDGLVRVALSAQKEVLLVALPKGKGSDYASARYTISEALDYLPVQLRKNIHFFTGLPVAEGVSDALTGYDNAVKYGANVVFCPNEFYRQLIKQRTCIGMDMDRPGDEFGAFAAYITGVPDVSAALARVDGCMSGALTADNLSKAAIRAQRGDIETVETLREKLKVNEKETQDLKSKARALVKRVNNLEAENGKLRDELSVAEGGSVSTRNAGGRGSSNRGGGTRDGGGSVLKKILAIAAAALILAIVGFLCWMISARVYTGKFFPPVYQKTAETQISDDKTIVPLTEESAERQETEAETVSVKAAETKEQESSLTEEPEFVRESSPAEEPESELESEQAQEAESEQAEEPAPESEQSEKPGSEKPEESVQEEEPAAGLTEEPEAESGSEPEEESEEEETESESESESEDSELSLSGFGMNILPGIPEE